MRPLLHRIVVGGNQQAHQDIEGQQRHGGETHRGGNVDGGKVEHSQGRGVDFKALRSCAMAASTSSSLEGMPPEITLGSPSVTRISSSMRTPMPLYFSNAGFTAAMNLAFSSVFGRLSSA